MKISFIYRGFSQTILLVSFIFQQTNAHLKFDFCFLKWLNRVCFVWIEFIFEICMEIIELLMVIQCNKCNLFFSQFFPNLPLQLITFPPFAYI